MLTVPELRDAEPGVFTRAAAKWQTLAQQVASRGDDLAKHVSVLDQWAGPAGEAAKQDLGDQRKRLADAAQRLGQFPPVLSRVGGSLTNIQNQLRTAMGTARDNSLVIEPDGAVFTADKAPPSATPRPMPGPSPQLDMPDPKQLAASLTTTIQSLLRQATAADEEAAAALRGLTAEASGLAPAADDSTLLAGATAVPTNASPADVKKWWDSLTPQQQESLLFMHGDTIGSLDGIPAQVRDRANRALLAEEKANLVEQRDRHPSDALNGKIHGLEAIEHRLTVTPSAEHPQPFLLKVSTDGTGRAIVAMGNPDTAANVATYVPGTGAALAKINGDLDRSDRMAMSALKAGSPSTSVITWLGYEAPHNIVPDAAEDKWADNGKGALNRFQDGLRATHSGSPSHNTVIGHSYGTTLVGHAARDGSLNANEVVFVASPGVGVTHAKDLHLTGVTDVSQHVHSTVARHDPIQLAAGIHGPSPTGLSFGGTTFKSDPGAAGPWYELGWNAAVHSQYWDPGNAALVNMGNVIAGKPTF
ncbi:alpha/beta hydrolase [Actinocrispum wychmicini]|uniref:Alpha/beta hydrolase family protein n=1 Tax=Actinocrispum wychmicini TaxID=1213861 RepID=A0A4R2J4Z4_9PSEU|nr:alpha/beta hydrolase [Actinocrispum wychmicini]TCO52372.1 alpha/beta hydrolase family protein [Actinocrispum wychmicini]